MRIPDERKRKSGGQNDGLGVLCRNAVSRCRLPALASVLLLVPCGSAFAQTLVSNIERIDPTTASLEAPGYATYRIDLYNTSNSAEATGVVLTHQFGRNALYDVTVSCESTGSAVCPGAGAVNIADGFTAGRVRITVPSLPTGGGLNPGEPRLTFTLKGVVRGYPRETITHDVQATGSGGVESSPVIIQDVLVARREGVVSRAAKSLVEPIPPEGLPWNEPLRYRIVFANDGDVPMPRPSFLDRHQGLQDQYWEQYRAPSRIRNVSEVSGCNIAGAAPPAGIGPQTCPYEAGTIFGPGTYSDPLEVVYWDDVLYPGQRVVVHVLDMLIPPSCVAHGEGSVDETGSVTLRNQVFFNTSRTFSNPDAGGGRVAYPGDTGRRLYPVDLPMAPLPDCDDAAEVSFRLTKERVTSGSIVWGEPERWSLSIENITTTDYGPVPVRLVDDFRYLLTNGSADIESRIVGCTDHGTGAVCPEDLSPPPVINATPVTDWQYINSSQRPLHAADALLPNGGRLTLELEITASNPSSACAKLSLHNRIWSASVVNPPDELITDEDGNTYERWQIVGETGGPNNTVILATGDTIRADGRPIVTYPPDPVACDAEGGTVDADPAVTMSVALPPVEDGTVAYDITVVNEQGSPGINSVQVTDDLGNSGIELDAGLLVTCEAVTRGATCPDDAAPGEIICDGNCDIAGSELSLLVGSLPADASVRMRVQGKFGGTIGGDYSNTVSIATGPAADYVDTDEGNNTSTVAVGVAEPSQLTITKVVTGDGYAGGSFDLTLTCDGVETASIDLADGDSETVGIPADTECVLSETGVAPLAPGYGWSAPVFEPSDTIELPASTTGSVTVTNTTERVAVAVEKSAGDLARIAEGTYEATYTVKVTNPNDSQTVYTLEDVFEPDPDVQVADGYPAFDYLPDASTDGLDTALGTYPAPIVSGEPIEGGDSTDIYTVTVRFTVSDSGSPDDDVCTGASGNGLFNSVTASVVGEQVDAAEACMNTPAPAADVTITKALTGESGAQPGIAEPGEALTYTITVDNASAADAVGVLVVDMVPEHTSFDSAGEGGVLADDEVQWTIDVPAEGSAEVTATFIVVEALPADVAAIVNTATADGVLCESTPCTETPVAEPELTIAKALTAESGQVPGQVEPGEQLTYTLTVENGQSIGAAGAEVVDVLPAGTTFVSADNDGTHEDGRVTWTIDAEPAATVELTVTLQVPDPLPEGVSAVVNDALVNDQPCAATPCVETPVVEPPVAVDDDGDEHIPGTAAVVMVSDNDTSTGAPLDPSSVWIVGAEAPGASLVVDAEGEWSVEATGAVRFMPAPGFTDDPTPVSYTVADTLGLRSNEATITLDYAQEALLRVTLEASARTVVAGDLLRFTAQIENIGTIDVVDTTMLTALPFGFVLVAESVIVTDADDAAALTGADPVRVGGLDIPIADTATVSFVVAVGAGVLPGAHTGTAVMVTGGAAGEPVNAGKASADGFAAKPDAGAAAFEKVALLPGEVAISNEASVTVTTDSDPLLEEARVLGTVFHDRDGDGWRDDAEVTGLTVTGGIDASVYVSGTTTIDRGDGPQPVSDADATLIRGLDLGRLPGRSSVAEPEDANRIVVSQLVSRPAFDDSFVLTTAQGTTVYMDAAGETRVERGGDAGRGLTAQDIRVSRTVTPLDAEYRVDYVISNAGVQEQGIPGVRLGTVEGLLIETDAYGRYHLEGIETSHYARGSNVIVKVDTATLPRGSTLTTDNPRIRRATPGLPVRFDFGVSMPEEVIEGGVEVVEMTLGTVLFEPDSAEIRARYAQVLDRMADELRARGGGDVEIVGSGGRPDLAYARARAVQDAVRARLDGALDERVRIAVRAEVDGPEVLALTEGVVIGEVFFETDATTIRPEFQELLESIAADIEAGDRPQLLIIGHADRRGADAYNVELGRRRAEAVRQAVTAELSPEPRQRVRVEYLPPPLSDPAAAGADGETEDRP